MEAKDFTIRKTSCSSPLPELELRMINAGGSFTLSNPGREDLSNLWNCVAE
jgi:hypothetical protein